MIIVLRCVSSARSRFFCRGQLRQLQTGKGKTAAYKYQGDERYIRVEMCLSWGMAAFSQPFFPDQEG